MALGSNLEVDDKEDDGVGCHDSEVENDESSSGVSDDDSGSEDESSDSDNSDLEDETESEYSSDYDTRENKKPLVDCVKALYFKKIDKEYGKPSGFMVQKGVTEIMRYIEIHEKESAEYIVKSYKSKLVATGVSPG